MSKHHVEKALIAVNNKIKRLEKQTGYVIKNQNKVIIVVTILSFLTPFCGTKDGKSIPDLLEMSYSSTVVFIFVAISSACLLGHVIWTIQDKAQMKRLLHRKKKLEDKLDSYN